jgi:hypothetical protein
MGLIPVTILMILGVYYRYRMLRKAISSYNAESDPEIKVAYAKEVKTQKVIFGLVIAGVIGMHLYFFISIGSQAN